LQTIKDVSRNELRNELSTNYSRMPWVKYTAQGFRSKQSFANAIHFHCIDLDLAADSAQSPDEPSPNGQMVGRVRSRPLAELVSDP
jgi:hypothetical protein